MGQMNKSLSLYMNGVRFLAAMLVFLFHMGYFSGWRVPIVGHYGSEAVIEFFVLSGFVISYTAKNKHPDLPDYALSRLARLWSISIPAIVLTCLLDKIGQHLALPAYSPMMPYSATKWIAAALANGAFLNQFWSFSIWPGTNGPFWSIAYEFWYYAIFGAGFYLTGRRRVFVVIAALLVAGPKIVAAFPIWLIGVALLRALPVDRRSTAPITGALVWCASLGFLVAFFSFDVSAWEEAAFPTIAAVAQKTWDVDFLPKSYLLGLILGMNLYGFMLLSGSITHVAKPLAAFISVLADASFGIYLFHYPIGYFVKAMLWRQGVTDGIGYIATIYLVSFAVSFGFGLLFDPLRKPLLRLLRRIMGFFPAPSAGLGLRAAALAPTGLKSTSIGS
jgi:peptidoglycan/LPS O-acetylase OafA/YrhL